MLSEKQIEELKTAIFMDGVDAIDNFLGFDCPCADKDTIDNMMDDVIMQMPEEDLLAFYARYIVQ